MLSQVFGKVELLEIHRNAHIRDYNGMILIHLYTYSLES